MDKVEFKNKILGTSKIIKIVLLFFIITVLLACICYVTINLVGSYNATKDYYNISADNTKDLFEIANINNLMFDPKAYQMFEDACLGNSNSNLLSNGTFCEKNGIVCKSINNTVLIANGVETIISEAPSSYINILGENVYFRNDVTRALCKYTISTGEIECIISENCDEVIVSTEGISFIDFSTSYLMYIPFETMKLETVSELPIQSFAVIGTKYLCLTMEKDVGILSANEKFKKLDSNVDRFFYNGTIAIQKGDIIYLLRDGNKIESTLQDVEGILVNYYDDKLFIRDKSAIDSYNLNINNYDEALVYVAPDSAIKSFCVLNNTYEMIVYDKKDALYSVTHQTIPKYKN